MSDILIDELTGDIDFTDGVLTLTDDEFLDDNGNKSLQATAQRLRQKLRFFFGEWFLDKSKGIPYFQQIFLKNPNPTVVESVFVSEIVSDPAVTELESIDFDVDKATRKLTLSFRARCDDTVIVFSDVLGV